MRDAEYDYGLEPGERFEPDEELDEPFDLTRPHVMTALGPVDPGALGFTLPGEYVYCRPPGGDPDLQLDDVARAVAELEGYALSGGRTLVDLSTGDFGRDAGEIRWVAERVPVHLVVAAGFRRFRPDTAEPGDTNSDEVAERIRRETVEGIDGTTVRAGVIVVGVTGNDIPEAEWEGVRAAARAHLTTGAPVTILADRGTRALETLSILVDAGVDPARVTTGGFDVTSDDDATRRLLGAGAFVRIQGWGRSPEGELAAMVMRFLDAGYGEQLLISGGFSRRSQWLAYGGGPGFVHFIDKVPLTLMEAGLGALAVRLLFVENPARALTTVRSAPG